MNNDNMSSNNLNDSTSRQTTIYPGTSDANADIPNVNNGGQIASNQQIISSGPIIENQSTYSDKPEKTQNTKRVLVALGAFVILIGGIIGVMYFTKAGIFGEKRISAGNHSFLINEHDWLINEVDESDYSITLDSNDENNITLSITDNPALSNYKYDDQSAGQAIGLIGKTTATKKTSEDVNCMVYDTSTSYQGVSFYLKSAFCDISNNYNAIVAAASQNSNVLEKYLNEGIEILKTGQK